MMTSIVGRAGPLPIVAVLAVLMAGSGGSAADGPVLTADGLVGREVFQPVTEPQLIESAGRLRRALDDLDAMLKISASGAAWRDYLDWPALEVQAAAGAKPDVDELYDLYELLDAEEDGLELREFAAVRQAVGAYLEAAVAASSPEAPAALERRLGKIDAALRKAAETGAAEPLEGIGPLLARLEESGQAPGTVARVRAALGRPNLLVTVHESLANQAGSRPVDEVAPICDTVLGTPVRGMGRTVGTVRIDFVPATGSALVDLVLEATNHSRTRGTQRPVTVHTVGRAEVTARKRIVLVEDGITPLPAEACVTLDTRTVGIDVHTQCAEGLIRKIAARKVEKLRPEAEAISSAKARRKARDQFEEQAAERLAQADRDYQAKFRDRLREQGLYPDLLQYATDDERLTVTARRAGTEQTAAFSTPPAVASAAGFGAQLHETFVNNVAETLLAGRTITREFVEKQYADNNLTVPESLKEDPKQPPWSITFAKRRPVELDLSDSKVRLTVRGSRYKSGEREFPAMNVWVTYEIKEENGRFRLVRDGDVQIYPPDFVPGGPDRLSGPQTSLRRILQTRFNKVFEPEIVVKPVTLPGEMAKIGPLELVQLVARKDGWLTAGLRAQWEASAAPAPACVAVPAMAAAR